MSDKKKSKQENIQPKAETNATVSTNITKDELKQMIVEAYFEIEKEKEKRQSDGEKLVRAEIDKIKNKHRCKLIMFFKLVKLRQEEEEFKGVFTVAWMGYILSLFFGLISLISFIFFIFSIILIINFFVQHQSWNRLFIYLMILIISPFFCIFSFGTAIEVTHEKDKNYLTSVFSGVVGFVALFVAFVSLLK